MIFNNNLSDVLNYLPTDALILHRQISGRRSTVFSNYKMSICDQVQLQMFWHTWRTWKILKKIWIQIFQFWNLYCTACEAKKMDEILKIATKEKSCEGNFREHQNFIPFSFTKKLRPPTWIFDVMYYFEW